MTNIDSDCVDSLKFSSWTLRREMTKVGDQQREILKELLPSLVSKGVASAGFDHIHVSNLSG